MENKKTNLDETIKAKRQYNKQLRSLMLKYKDGRKERQTLVKFNQPCCILLRKNNHAEFLEANKRNGLISAIFKYKHSNGKDMTVDFSGASPYKMPYGKDFVLAYFHHEDHATAINSIFDDPMAPIIRFNEQLQHQFSAVNKWDAEKAKAFALNWKYLALLLAVAVGGYLLYIILNPAQSVPAVASQVIPPNATIIYTT